MRIHYFLIAYKSLFFTWSLWTHWTYGESVATVVVAPSHFIQIEAQVACIARIDARSERTRPEIAAATYVF